MKNPDEPQTLFLSPLGGAIAIVCFFLPWVKFDCGGVRDTANGADLGGIVWLVLLAALAIVAAFFYFRSLGQLQKSRPIILWSSIVALAILVIRYLIFASGESTPYGRIRPQDIGFSLQIGAFGTLLGFIAALVGIKYLPSPDDDTSEPTAVSAATFDPAYFNKTCPNCKETIKLEATTCRFCHREFSQAEVSAEIDKQRAAFKADQKAELEAREKAKRLQERLNRF